jgi:hypothetical protein
LAFFAGRRYVFAPVSHPVVPLPLRRFVFIGVAAGGHPGDIQESNAVCLPILEAAAK